MNIAQSPLKHSHFRISKDNFKPSKQRFGRLTGYFNLMPLRLLTGGRGRPQGCQSRGGSGGHSQGRQPRLLPGAEYYPQAQGKSVLGSDQRPLNLKVTISSLSGSLFIPY